MESLSESNDKKFLTHSCNEHETESDSNKTILYLFETRHVKLLTVSKFARNLGTSEENWSEKVKDFCVGKAKTV